MFEKYVIPITMSVGMILSIVGFILTKDLQFGIILTWYIIWLCHKIEPRTVNIFLEAPKDDNKRQEEKTDEGDSHRD